MAGFNFETLNNKKTVRDGVNTDEMEFVPLVDFVGGEIAVDGYFFTNGKYGKQVVVVGNGAKINMPGYAVEKFERLDEIPEAVDAMLAGGMKIIDIQPLKTKNGETVAFTLANAN